MSSKSFKQDELNKIKYFNMLHNFDDLNLEIIEARMNSAKITNKYPISTFVNILSIDENNLRSFKEIKEYYFNLLQMVNNVLTEEERYTEEEIEILLRYMIVNYYQRISKDKSMIDDVIDYNKDFEKYLTTHFEDELIEYFKNEVLYQLVIFLGVDPINYQNGKIGQLILYLDNIKDTHELINPDETIKGVYFSDG
jgi:hypothetical protein